jgi:hypothetical protein
MDVALLSDLHLHSEIRIVQSQASSGHSTYHCVSTGSIKHQVVDSLASRAIESVPAKHVTIGQCFFSRRIALSADSRGHQVTKRPLRFVVVVIQAYRINLLACFYHNDKKGFFHFLNVRPDFESHFVLETHSYFKINSQKARKIHMVTNNLRCEHLYVFCKRKKQRLSDCLKYSVLAYFPKMNISLSNHQPVCLCVCVCVLPNNLCTSW